MSLQTGESSPATKQIYHLGDAVFTLKNCDATFLQTVEKILPHFTGDPSSHPEIEEINTGCTKEILDLIRHVASLHQKQKYVWIEASCLLTPTGKKVLIAGKSQSGKSTTALALSLGKRWSILAENLCLINYESRRVLKHLAPAALDEKALEVLQTQGVSPERTYSLEWRKNRVWAPVLDVIGERTYDPNFDLAIWLERDDQADSPFSVNPISSGEFARKALTVSNLLKIKGASDSFFESIAQAKCLAVTGGELNQRLDTITGAVSPT